MGMHAGTGPGIARPPRCESVMGFLATRVAGAGGRFATFGVATPEPFSVIKGDTHADGEFTFFSGSGLC